jgi:hypothetical protein
MPRRMSRPLPLLPPADLTEDKLPNYGTAELCAQAATYQYGPVSPRTIRETWELEWRIVNGRAVTHIPSFLEEARRRFDASRVVVGGRPKISTNSQIEAPPQTP